MTHRTQHIAIIGDITEQEMYILATLPSPSEKENRSRTRIFFPWCFRMAVERSFGNTEIASFFDYEILFTHAYGQIYDLFLFLLDPLSNVVVGICGSSRKFVGKSCGLTNVESRGSTDRSKCRTFNRVNWCVMDHRSGPNRWPSTRHINLQTCPESASAGDMSNCSTNTTYWSSIRCPFIASSSGIELLPYPC